MLFDFYLLSFMYWMKLNIVRIYLGNPVGIYIYQEKLL